MATTGLAYISPTQQARYDQSLTNKNFYDQWGNTYANPSVVDTMNTNANYNDMWINTSNNPVPVSAPVGLQGVTIAPRLDNSLLVNPATQPSAYTPTGLQGVNANDPLSTSITAATAPTVPDIYNPQVNQEVAAQGVVNSNTPTGLDYMQGLVGLGQLGLGIAQYGDTKRTNEESRKALKENIKNAREARQFRSGLAGAFA